MKHILLIFFLSTVASISQAQLFSIGDEQQTDSTAQSEGGIVKEDDQKKTGAKKDTKDKTWKDKFYFGGNVGAQFGTNTMVDLSPNIGYKIIDRWSVGVQLSYQYLNLRTFNYKTHILGVSGFTRVFVFDNLFLHTEYGVINGNFNTIDPQSETLQNWYVGGGYNYRVGGKFGVSGMMLYNLLQSTYHPYQNPIITVGINYGL